MKNSMSKTGGKGMMMASSKKAMMKPDATMKKSGKKMMANKKASGKK